MKRLVTILLVAAALGQANAQFFQMGLKAGLGSSKFRVNEEFTATETGETILYRSGEAVLGWHLGLYSRIKISRFYIQPELLYASTGGKVLVSSDGIDYNGSGKFKLYEIDIPVMAGFYLTKSFRIYAGPTLSYLISEKSAWNTTIDVFRQDFQKGNLGYQAGIGFDISKVSLDLKYEGSLNALGESLSIPGTDIRFDTDLRNSQLMLSFGLRF